MIFNSNDDWNSYNHILGVSVGHEKPIFEVFLKPIIIELKKLEYGLVVKINTTESKLLYFFVIFGVFDKPARAAILNMVNSTGYYGCLKCSQKGINYETKRGIQNWFSFNKDLFHFQFNKVAMCIFFHFKKGL